MDIFEGLVSACPSTMTDPVFQVTTDSARSLLRMFISSWSFSLNYNVGGLTENYSKIELNNLS